LSEQDGNRGGAHANPSNSATTNSFLSAQSTFPLSAHSTSSGPVVSFEECRFFISLLS